MIRVIRYGPSVGNAAPMSPLDASATKRAQGHALPTVTIRGVIHLAA